MLVVELRLYLLILQTISWPTHPFDVLHSLSTNLLPSMHETGELSIPLSRRWTESLRTKRVHQRKRCLCPSFFETFWSSVPVLVRHMNRALPLDSFALRMNVFVSDVGEYLLLAGPV